MRIYRRQHSRESLSLHFEVVDKIPVVVFHISARYVHKDNQKQDYFIFLVIIVLFPAIFYNPYHSLSEQLICDLLFFDNLDITIILLVRII
jgi:hypothetical protein